MTKSVKIILVSALSIAMGICVLYGFLFGITPQENLASNSNESVEEALKSASILNDSAEEAMEKNTAIKINLENMDFLNGVQKQENMVTISSPGIYDITGKLEEGQLVINCKDNVVLILNNVEISNSKDAAISIIDAKHTLFYLPEGAINTLSSGIEQEITEKDDPLDSVSGAALYAKDSISIAGEGSLNVRGYINNAIASTNHLIVLNGNLELTAVNNGLKGKDSVTVKDGNINIHSGNDGIKSNNDTEEIFGNVEIYGGEINITSLGDGIQAQNNVLVEDGILNISAGNIETIDSKTETNFFENGFMPQNMPEENFNPEDMPENPFGEMSPPNTEMNEFSFDNRKEPNGMKRGDESAFGSNRNDNPRNDLPEKFEQESNKNEEQASTKGIKSGKSLTVKSGNITINSVDDCIHSNGSLNVNGGIFNLSTSDDGIHADGTLTISDGNITVSKSYEGIEGYEIYINEGTISVTASDDGINAGGDSQTSLQAQNNNSSKPVLQINGGDVHVNAQGDGLDSNGDLIIEGGNIIVDGPTNGGNGALDYGTETSGHILCDGGTILAIGASGMAETFENDSKQCSFIQDLSQTMEAGTQITISDEEGQIIYEYISIKSFSSVVFSSPELIQGKKYILTAGTLSYTIQINDISNGTSTNINMSRGFGKQK